MEPAPVQRIASPAKRNRMGASGMENQGDPAVENMALGQGYRGAWSVVGGRTSTSWTAGTSMRAVGELVAAKVWRRSRAVGLPGTSL